MSIPRSPRPHFRFERGDTIRLLLLFCFLLAWGIAHGDDSKSGAKAKQAASSAPTFPSLKAEMDAHHMADDLVQARVRLGELESRRRDAITATRSLVRGDREGLTLLKNYMRVVNARYVDEEGDFDKTAEVSGDDVTNLNQLFDHYLHRMPFAAQWGKVSAGFARASIDKGIDQLDDQASAHEDPDPSNNGELEIIALQIKTEEASIDRLVDLADSRGIKLDPKAPLPENSRLPASDSSQ